MYTKYSKFIVAIVAAIVTAIGTYYVDAQPEWFPTLVAILSALGVYQVKNK
jgi:hypothetical protein